MIVFWFLLFFINYEVIFENLVKIIDFSSNYFLFIILEQWFSTYPFSISLFLIIFVYVYANSFFFVTIDINSVLFFLFLIVFATYGSTWQYIYKNNKKGIILIPSNILESVYKWLNKIVLVWSNCFNSYMILFLTSISFDSKSSKIKYDLSEKL
jgi:hypothetical protein